MILFSSTNALAATLTVRLPHVASDDGDIRCAVYSSADGFPGQPDRAARFLAVPARRGVATCVFEDLAPGVYAVAVSHDANRSGGLERSSVGRPTEGWGTSNDVTHLLSGPTFEESAFRFDASTVLDVELHYP